MEKFSVSLSGLQSGASGLGESADALKKNVSMLSGMGVAKHSSRAQTRLLQAQQKLLNEQTMVNQMAMTLNGISGLYKRAEEKIVSGRQESPLGQVIDIVAPNISAILSGLQDEEYCFSVLSPGVIGAVLLSDIEVGASLAPGTEESELSRLEWDFFKAKNKWKLWAKDPDDEKRRFGKAFERKYSNDNNEKKLKRVPENEKDKKDKNDKIITEKDIAESITIAGFTYSLLDEDKKGNVLFENDIAKISNGKKELSIDGKVTFGSVDVGISGEYSVLALELKGGQLGNDMIGLHSSVELDLASVSGDAKIGVGWLNEDGELDPHLYGEIGAEAVLGKVSADIGVDVLGADVDVKASMGVGIGVHLEAGFDDGVLSLELGAYLGLGADVSLEIDLTKSIEYAVDIASDAVGVVQDVGEAIGSGIQKAGEFLSDGWKKLKFW